jgi:hypothetical protein
MQAAVAMSMPVCMGGQGARRARNWRHNRPGSPYCLARLLAEQAAREHPFTADLSSLCPAQRLAVEQARLAQQKQQSAPPPEEADDC